MLTKSEKLQKYLKKTDFEVFTFQRINSLDVFKHTENVDGIPIQSFIAIGENPATEITYILGNCTDALKHERLVFFMNELNVQRKLKFCIDDKGLITASFHYYADDDNFNADALISLYVVFFESLIKEGDIRKIMKIIWS
ncbi:MAG: hypothetical protein IJZ55_08405 [Lachnospiraceae bacterium]|nr:hypothetical protein [Lachnospiraceae bacterium]